MNATSAERVNRFLIDVGDYDIDLGGVDAAQPDELTSQVASMLTDESGYCVLYGTNRVLARHGLDIRNDRVRAYELLESVFRNALAKVDLAAFSVVPQPMSLDSMDVDGYNLNQSFSHDGNVASRAFMTSKCLHFDAATPFVGNIYGPNDNIAGGYPVICDARSYCRDRGVEPRELVENIPNNYNVAIREEHYDDLRDHYSFGLQLDFDGDVSIVTLLNEVDFGVAHGATEPFRRDESQPAKRPIRHIEYQFAEEEHYDEWYRYYGLDILEASDYQGENLSLEYHQPTTRPFDQLIRVAS